MRKYSKRLNKISDLRRFMAAQINALDSGVIDENRLRCLAYAVNVLAGIIRDSDLEQRVEKLEAMQENGKK